MYSNGYNIYKTNTVNYASKEQLLLMLVEGAVKFCKMGRQAIIDKDINKAHDSLVRTQDIFSELMISLDTTQGDWTVQLFNVYGFVKQKLVEANMKKDIEIIDEILPIIEDINETWKEAYKRAKK
ncbi:flagellar export chaperone FliS [uncultured Clostridium sp.]|uniref:flagellar export chaperone FliS n=1 Tax=uncultured Clostridium sp. TaxID=59620 RepID=UPI0028EE34B6|nr:flagellar export chaperone FliS [uncultured Clostridium sp.]